MERKTDLQKVKEIAKELLNVPILETEYSPMIVSHPFANCGLVVVPYDDDYYQLNISKPDAFNKWKNIMSEQIDNCVNAHHIFYMVNNPYRLMFVDAIADCLSNEEFATLLGEAWVTSEYANEDANVSKKEVLAHFKNADKKALMSDSEFASFRKLEDNLVVYRGVSVEKKDSTDALSWTTSFGTAKWFAERWGKGVVYAADINKSDVLAYFNRKEEDEVVVDFNKLQNVRVVTRPQSKPEPNSMQ